MESLTSIEHNDILDLFFKSQMDGTEIDLFIESLINLKENPKFSILLAVQMASYEIKNKNKNNDK